MELLFLRIWVFVITFCLGISISALWRIYTLPALPIPVVELTPPPPAEAEVEQSDGLRIVNEPHNCGAVSEPATYILSDGGHISFFCKTYNSRAAAARELEKRLINAAILERTPKTDSYGNTVGEEIVITAPNVVRLVKDGRALCVTEATSLEHLRWFQNLYRY